MQLCEEVVNLLLQVDDRREAIAILDLVKARLNLRAASDESAIRRLQEDALNPVIGFFPQQPSSETETV